MIIYGIYVVINYGVNILVLYLQKKVFYSGQVFIRLI